MQVFELFKYIFQHKLHILLVLLLKISSSIFVSKKHYNAKNFNAVDTNTQWVEHLLQKTTATNELCLMYWLTQDLY